MNTHRHLMCLQICGIGKLALANGHTFGHFFFKFFFSFSSEKIIEDSALHCEFWTNNV